MERIFRIINKQKFLFKHLFLKYFASNFSLLKFSLFIDDLLDLTYNYNLLIIINVYIYNKIIRLQTKKQKQKKNQDN